MKTYKALFCLILLMIILSSCIFRKPLPSEFVIQNNSDSAIYVYVTYNDSLPSYPTLKLFDTIFEQKHNKNIDNVISPSYRINAYSSNIDNHSGNLNIIENSNAHLINNLKIYIIKESIMRRRSWREIHIKQMYEKKVLLSKKQLADINLEVIYTGNGNASEVLIKE